MDLNRMLNANSKTLYYGGLVAALAFLAVSQFILSVVLPPYGPNAPAGLMTLGLTLTVLSVASAGVMAYSMVKRRRGE